MGKNSKENRVDIQALLKLANENTVENRVENTIKLYQDKLNIALNSGVENGVKYSVKVGGSTLIIYQDENGTTHASVKGKTGLMLSLNASVKNNTIYKNAVKNGKMGKTCKDYTITHNENEGVDYLLVNLNEHKR